MAGRQRGKWIALPASRCGDQPRPGFRVFGALQKSLPNGRCFTKRSRIVPNETHVKTSIRQTSESCFTRASALKIRVSPVQFRPRPLDRSSQFHPVRHSSRFLLGRSPPAGSGRSARTPLDKMNHARLKKGLGEPPVKKSRHGLNVNFFVGIP